MRSKALKEARLAMQRNKKRVVIDLLHHTSECLLTNSCQIQPCTVAVRGTSNAFLAITALKCHFWLFNSTHSTYLYSHNSISVRVWKCTVNNVFAF
ncbi:hypothetical protein FKM82_012576 [Ascaphus truei]